MFVEASALPEFGCLEPPSELEVEAVGRWMVRCSVGRGGDA